MAAQVGLGLTWSQTPKTGFLVTRLKFERTNIQRESQTGLKERVKSVVGICTWASPRENLSSGFSTRVDSNRSVQLKKLASVMKLQIQKLVILYYLGSDNKGADQTARMRRLICAFVVRIWQKQVFSWRGSPYWWKMLSVVTQDCDKLFWSHRVISTPEPKAHWWAYSIGRPLSSVGMYVCMSTFSNIFSSETTGAIEAKFQVELSMDGGTKVCSNGPGHMTSMAAMPIYSTNLKNLLLWTKKTDYLESWYAASGTRVLSSLFKWWHWVDRDLFYGKVNFAPLCFCMGKR